MTMADNGQLHPKERDTCALHRMCCHGNILLNIKHTLCQNESNEKKSTFFSFFPPKILAYSLRKKN